MCGLTNEIIAAQPSHYWAKGDNNGTAACFYDSFDEVSCSSDLEFSSLSQHAWKVQTSTGMYEGIASCNSTIPSEYETLFGEAMSQMQAGTMTFDDVMVYVYNDATMKRSENTFSSNSTGQYCWCKATGYTPNNGQNQCSNVSLSWLFIYDSGSSSDCARNCVINCSNNVFSVSAYRTALFSN
jgi:hypothetical protein